MDKHFKLKWATKPYPLQQEIIDHLDGKILSPKGTPYRFLIPALGRQSGKSWLARRTLIDRANNRKQVCMWVAPVIPSAISHWDSMVAEVSSSGIPTKKINQSRKEIHFFGGGVISVRSALEPDNLRGASLDYVVLDEAAFFRDGDYVWYQVVLPMITATRGVVLMPTTPNGHNWLYRIFLQGLDPRNHLVKSWNVPSSASPYQDLELLAELEKTMPSLSWREEFLAEFIADGGGVFAGIEEAATIDLLREPLPGHTYLAGIDFGFTNDNTAFTVIDKYTREQVYGEAFSNIGTVRTVKRLIRLLDLWNPETTYVEKNGIGEALFDLLRQVASGRDIEDILEFINDRTPEKDDETLEEVIGGHKLRGVHMNNDLKRSHVEKLSADIEYGRLKILKKDVKYGALQMSEMSTYERKRTITGVNVTYAAAGDAHDDTVTALYLANKGLPRVKKWKLPSKEKDEKPRRNPFRGSTLGGRGRRIKNAKRSKVHSPH